MNGLVPESGNMLVYCNGDSFVAGVELGDDVLPGHPGAFDYDQVPDSAREWIANTYNPKHPYSIERDSRIKELIELEYQRAFPNKVKELLNVDVVNHGMGGSSMDRIVRTSITALIELKKKHDNIVAFIGDTDCNRSEVPNFQYMDYVDGSGFNRHWLCMAANYYMPNRKPVEPLVEYKLRYEKNYHGLVTYYKNVILLQDFCAKNNITLYWVQTFGRDNVVPEPEYENDPCLNNFKEYADFKYTVSMADIGKKMYHNVMCPSRHFAENVHDAVALEIVNIIKENHNV